MARKKHIVEQVIGKLREAEAALSKGQTSSKRVGAWASPNRRSTGGGTSKGQGVR